MANDDKLSWLLGAIGLTGALVALGYIVRTAQGDLLGISTYDSERAGYLLAAGDLIVHTLLLLLHWPTLVALIIGVLLVIGLEWAKRRFPSFVHARSYLAIGLVVLCAMQLTFFVLPATPINNTLVDSICPDRYFEVSHLIRWRTEQIWKDTLCSRVSKEILSECGNTAPGEYLTSLDHDYVAAVLIAALLWILGWRILFLNADDSPNWPEIIPWQLGQVLLITSLLLVAIGAAYLYGKTVQSTTFPLAEVDFAPGIMVSAPPGEAAETPSTSAKGVAKKQKGLSLYVVATKSDNTVLYDPLSDRVLFVRNSAINYEKASSLRDILYDRIARQKDSCER